MGRTIFCDICPSDERVNEEDMRFVDFWQDEEKTKHSAPSLEICAGCNDWLKDMINQRRK